MRPFFPYFGSKWRMARHYPAPSGDTVVEPFAGGAGYACFHDVPRAILVDKDPVIAGVWSYLIAVSPAEIMALPDLPAVGDCVDDHAIPQEAKWLIGFWLNRGSASPKKSRTAYSARSDRSQLNWGPGAKQRIASQIPLISGWQIVHGGYEDCTDVEATWFIDPPYGDKGRYYRVPFNGFIELGNWCRRRRGLVIACEGPDATWLPFRPLGSFKSTRGRADESVCVLKPAMRGDAERRWPQSL